MSRTLDHLFDRNAAWADAKLRRDPTFFRRMAEQQTPRYLWIGCSDSRVTANDVLGLDPGEVFVHRNIANIVHTSDMNILSVLEFAVEHLQVEHIMVCGHYGCGGVRRALVTERGALLDHWLQPIAMLHRKHKAVFDAIPDVSARLDRMCEINIEMQVRRLAQTPIVENAWARGQTLHLHGWIYAIHDGLLRDLGPHLSSLADRDALPSIDHRVLDPVEPVSAARRDALLAFASADIDLPPCCAAAFAELQDELSPGAQVMLDLKPVPIGILVCSDRASAGIYEDRGGPAIQDYLDRVLVSSWRPILSIVRDERPAIAAALIHMADGEGCPLILTTGGTGPSPRDVTPEATVAVCDRLLPGFGEVMRQASLRDVPTAILSRQLAGSRGISLIVNLPGKPSAISVCLNAVFSAIPYCIDLLGGPHLDTDPSICRAFRPAT